MIPESPINSAIELMRSIASAMDALLLFWRNPAPDVVKVGGIRNAVDFIEVNYAELRDLVPQVAEYVADAWNGWAAGRRL